MDAHIRINVLFPEDEPTVKKFIGWRCLHEAEGGYDSDSAGMPEVRPALPNPLPVEFTMRWQLLSWDMNKWNPLFTKNNWRAVYGDTTAFTNGNGFGNKTDPRADYINGLNIDKENPKLMKAIICGGMFIRGEVQGSNLVCKPGIHGISSSGPLPTVEEVMRKNWYFVATTQKDGKVSHFPQGHGKPVYIPYILRQVVTYPLKWFERWESDELPDPLKLYR